MSSLHAALEDYLAVRRALGHKLAGAEYLLRKFIAYLGEQGAATVTTSHAMAWATFPAGASAVYQAQRLSAVRGFASWLRTLDPAAEVPPAGILAARASRAVPYLYTGDEIAALMAAAQRLRYPMRRCTYEALTGFLAVTGLRVGEAIRLDRDDVCFDAGLVRVIRSKFGKSREVPLHPDVVQALRRYADRRDQLLPEPKAPSFFLSATGDRLIYRSVASVFVRLVRHAGLGPRSERCRPRIHDLRHSFAVSTLLDWHRAGMDVQAMLPLLSTYMGHVDPKSTYWYLTGTPELLGLAARRLEDAFEVAR